MLFLPIMSYASSCIHPMDIGIRQESTVVSAKQKWVDSGITVSHEEEIENIEILSNKVSLCKGKRNKTFIVEAGKRNEYKLPFPLYAGDKIMFSVVGSKMCIKQDDTQEYKTINGQCDKGSQEYFAKVLNKWDCKYEVCPNKHVMHTKDAVWLHGKEYWGSNMKKEDIDKSAKQLTEVIKNYGDDKNALNQILQDAYNEYDEIDTYILNFMFGNICDYNIISLSLSNYPQCVMTYSINDDDLFKLLESSIKEKRYKYIGKLISDFLEGKQKSKGTSIPGLSVKLSSEDFGRNSIRTNHGYEITKDHNEDDTVSFNLPEQSYGGYNIMISVIQQGDFGRDLYIHIDDNDKIPEHSPGNDSQKDIIVNDGNIGTALKGKKGTIYYGVKDYGCDYKDNEGEFNINLTIVRQSKKIVSSIYKFFINKVKEKFSLSTRESHVKNIYERLTKGIRPMIISLLVLFIVMYTLCYFCGLSNISVYEFLMICIRIGVVAQLLSDGSWNFFYGNLFSFFENVPSQLMGIVNYGEESNGGMFAVFDESFDRFFSWRSWQLMISLIFSGPFGIVLFCLTIWGTVVIAKSLFNALFSFATYGVIIALLVALAPIFIVCILFKYTRRMFMLWIGGMATFGLQPVILIIVMQLIMSAMRYVVYSIFNFTACTQCILSINPLNVVPIINSVVSADILSICLLNGYVADYFPDICAIMSFIILAHSLKAMVEFSFNISQALFSNTSMPIEGPGKQLRQSVLETMGLENNHGETQSMDRPIRRPISSNQG